MTEYLSDIADKLDTLRKKMEAKHTPGPWLATDTTDFEFGHVSSSPDGQGDIATTWGDNAKANARLISAAPDLLDALKRAADFLDPTYDPPRITRREMVEIARAAIAKAEGRS